MCTQNEHQQAGNELAKESAANAEGYGNGEEGSSEFNEGYEAGRRASDPNNTSDPKENVKEYAGLNEAEKRAFRAGWRRGQS